MPVHWRGHFIGGLLWANFDGALFDQPRGIATIKAVLVADEISLLNEDRAHRSHAKAHFAQGGRYWVVVFFLHDSLRGHAPFGQLAATIVVETN